MPTNMVLNPSYDHDRNSTTKQKMIEQQTFEAFKSHINQDINVNVLNLLFQ